MIICINPSSPPYLRRCPFYLANSLVSLSHRPRRRCDFYDLHKELVPYGEAWTWQNATVKEKKALSEKNEDLTDSLIILQHHPVYTLGAASSEEYLNFDARNAPFDLYRTERGGEVTYHGPGQLVMYPILNLRYHKMDLHWYLRSLEEVVIHTLSSAFAIKASRIEGLTGVWVGNGKLAAIGIKVSSWITYHGLALNVTTDMTPFEHIVPCGIQDRQVGSIKGLVKGNSLSNEKVTSIIADKVRKDVSLVRGVKKELRSLSRELNTIRRVLVDAERRRFKEDSIKDWLKRLESTAYEMDDLLDEWNFAIRKIQIEQSGTANFVLPPKYKVRSFIMPRCLYFRKLATLHDTAKKIESVKEKLGAIVAEKDRYGFMITSQPIDSPRPEWRVQSTSLIDLEEVCGRKNESEDLVSKLVAEELGIRIICVVGVGGLGKTTLAKLAYNDSRMESAFQLRVWICVSDPFNESEIANEIIEGAKGIK